MKVFWTLLVLGLLAAGILAVVGGKPSGSPAPASVDPAPIRQPAKAMPEAPSPVSPAAELTRPSAPAPTPAPAPAPKLDDLLGTKPETEPPASKPPAPAAPSPTAKVDTPKPAAEPSKPAPATAKAAEGDLVEVPEHPKFPSAKLQKAKVIRKPDGSLWIDDRYRVTGKGTEDDPFKLPWELMTSTKDSYNPQLGLMKMPQRVVMFDGKHVKLTGFTAFPLSAQTPKEMLVMLNQWDGCCIGVPPTAYDAVEVRLAKAGTAEDKLNVHGSVTGVFQVDPYESNGWLMGLYLMNDAHAEYDQ